VKHDGAAGQGIGGGQQPGHHPHGVPQEAAVARLVHESCRNSAVHPDNLTLLDRFLVGIDKYCLVDRFPCLGSDRADRLVQYRLLRRPCHRQAGESPEGGRVLKMKGKFLVAQLTMLFEQGAAQRRFRRQALPPGLLHAVAAQIRRHAGDQRRMRIQPQRHRLQLTPDLVPGKQIEYACLDGAFLTHCRLRW
jgi:hypothetical protein